MVLMLMSSFIFAQNVVLVNENFSTGALPAGWSMIDNDGDTYNWDPAYGLLGHNPVPTDSACISSASYINGVGALTPDNFLVTKNVTGADSVYYYVCAQDAAYAGEYYDLMASTTGSAVGDFTVVFSETMTAKGLVSSSSSAVEKNNQPRGNSKAQGAWYKRSIDVPAGTKYIAWRHHNCTDMFWLNLDDVTIVGVAPTVPVADCSPAAYNAGTLVLPASATSGTFTLTNSGAGTLTCSGITGISAPWTTTLVPASVSLAAGASTTFTFTYAPSAVGVNNQTVVIATNGGDITITLAGEAVECNTISSFPWVESFESATFPPVCWTKASPDGGTGWAQIADGTTPLPGWYGGTMTIPTGGGANAAYCTWSTGGSSSNDQWLITPQIAVQANQELSYYVFWNGGYYDQLDVKVSTTTNAEASFTTTLLSSDTTSFMADDWVKLSIPLTAYASQNVYFAFNEHVLNNTDDGAFIGLDLVTVDVATSIVENGNYTINVFPNPANDRLYIDAENVKQVNVFNVLGNLVAEYGSVNAINTSDLNNGAYIIVVITETNVSKSMINIVH